MAWDPVWEDIFNNQSWGKYPGEDLIRFVARNFYHVPDRSQVKILEVGCGPGANLWFMAREGFSISGIDGSQTAVNLARSKLDLECPDWMGMLHCGDIAQLPFMDMTFDAVIDNECLYCNPFESSRLIYSEMARVTKVGGKLFSRTFAAGSWGDSTGTPAGHHAWLCSEGPQAEKGPSRFTSFDEIDDLVSGWIVNNVELITHTRDKMTHTIKEFIIEGTRK